MPTSCVHCFQVINGQLQNFGFFQFRWSLFFVCRWHQTFQLRQWWIDAIAAFLFNHTSSLFATNLLAAVSVIVFCWDATKENEGNQRLVKYSHIAHLETRKFQWFQLISTRQQTIWIKANSRKLTLWTMSLNSCLHSHSLRLIFLGHGWEAVPKCYELYAVKQLNSPSEAVRYCRCDVDPFYLYFKFISVVFDFPTNFVGFFQVFFLCTISGFLRKIPKKQIGNLRKIASYYQFSFQKSSVKNCL